MKKNILSLSLVLGMGLFTFTGCGNYSNNISLVTREDGSGTRSAFVELFEITDENKNDLISQEAVTISKTDVMLTQISGDKNAIGYVSAGSLNNTVKAMKIDGVEASAVNIKNGSYKISRPFNIAAKGEPTGLAKDFIDYIMSSDGQAVVEREGCVAVNDSAEPYDGDKPSGTISVDGSTSVTPLMEKLKEAYLEINPNAKIELNTSDSSTGMKNTTDGICDIGMASRALKDSEKETLTGIQIALDGIAVIVHKDNEIGTLTSEQVKSIFMGETLNWDELK